MPRTGTRKKFPIHENKLLSRNIQFHIHSCKHFITTQCLVFLILSNALFVQARPTRSSADADNRLDAFSGQSTSTNMVPFHMLHIVSYCATAIVTLSLRRAVFTIFVFKKFHDLEMGSKVTQGH